MVDNSKYIKIHKTLHLSWITITWILINSAFRGIFFYCSLDYIHPAGQGDMSLYRLISHGEGPDRACWL